MKVLKKVLTIAMAVAMIATMSVTAFAGGPTPVRYNDTDTVYLTKQMNIAKEQGEFHQTFTFTFTLNGAASDVNAPTINDQTINIDRAAGATNDQIIATEALDLNPDGSGDINWGTTEAHAGTFVYTVNETAVGGINCDDNTYTLSVAFKNGASGLEVGQISIADGAEKIDDANKPYNDANDNDTQDPGEADGNSFRFVNTKVADVIADPDGDGPSDSVVDKANEAPYFLSNTVTGDYADKTKDFTYTVTVAMPAGVAPDAYVTEANAKGTGTVSLSGSTYTVKLSDGENFYFDKLPAGAVVTAKQVKEDNYTASAAPAGTDGTTYDTTYTVKATLAENTGVAYTNTFDDATVNLTGVIVENLPFVVMGLVAIAGCALVIVTRRKHDAE